MSSIFPNDPFRSLTVIGALIVSSASLAFSAIEGSCGRGLLDLLQIRETPSASSVHDEPHATGTEILSGIVEAIPDRVFRIMPYNDWPLLRIDVHEGQRLTWTRKNGAWVGDNDILTTQNETPAEIDGTIIEADIAVTELAAAKSKSELAVVQAEADLELARIRERNARQELDRITGLKRRDVESNETHLRAENLWNLAMTERTKAERILGLQKKLAESEVAIAEARVVQTKSDLDLANFKRDMSWGKAPVHLVKGPNDRPKQLVVTKVAAVIGDQPPRAGSPPVWVELLDDSKLFVRTSIEPEREDEVPAGSPVRILQHGRTYEGSVVALLPIVDPESQNVVVLVQVENHDRKLRVGSAVKIDRWGVER
jgi:hypothetical protein